MIIWIDLYISRNIFENSLLCYDFKFILERIFKVILGRICNFVLLVGHNQFKLSY